MKSLQIAVAVAAFTLPVAVFAQAPAQPSGPAAEALAAYNRVKPNILKAAEKMPADAYSYKPTPDIRTFARVVNHVTEAQNHVCSALLGAPAPDPKTMPLETADKETIVTALKASFDLCDKAYASLTDGQVLEVLTLGPVKRTRLGLAWGNVSHDNEQYATLALYLRLKGLVPPSSEK
jgi:uncharacterized damage-inducible protein DinB